jgi:hypothetical protein
MSSRVVMGSPVVSDVPDRTVRDAIRRCGEHRIAVAARARGPA